MTINLPVKVIYEDDDLLALNKPAGLLVQPVPGRAFGAGEKTLVDYFSHYHLVHRLDRDTSGVLVVAKRRVALEYLKRQFHDRLIKKNYLAIVYGNLRERTGKIDLPIGRHPKYSFLRFANPNAKPPLREALTVYQVKQSFTTYDYLSLWPKTGRTHQLRVHLQALGHPILCDQLYAKRRPCLPMMRRQALHAASLELILPNGVALVFAADLPVDFQTTLDYLRQSC